MWAKPDLYVKEKCIDYLIRIPMYTHNIHLYNMLYLFYCNDISYSYLLYILLVV